jgi:hypothetical protein
MWKKSARNKISQLDESKKELVESAIASNTHFLLFWLDNIRTLTPIAIGVVMHELGLNVIFAVGTGFVAYGVLDLLYWSLGVSYVTMEITKQHHK